MHNLSIVELEQIVRDFALAMEAVDTHRPQASSRRTTARHYQPGVGPLAEDDAVSMAVAQMRADHGSVYLSAGKRRYPSGNQTCDLALGDTPEWAIEVKLARVGRDNGTYEDAAIKKIPSPYADDRSAVTDCVKLARSDFAGRRAVLIDGFEDPHRPLFWLIEAFEAAAPRPAPVRLSSLRCLSYSSGVSCLSGFTVPHSLTTPATRAQRMPTSGRSSFAAKSSLVPEMIGP